ncbi:hypothetical protein CYMTET_48911 [Cymbomonas tetramitiformis]|uniref:Uncharacterized protein n=1 Tax=Cymbomonas tetramitiformis TaxID=36881 RepID=A0AAE0BR96_9CHLO|nr:hypothetical protein CYMTET_48911 [Cymbomonas tetramitiformis]
MRLKISGQFCVENSGLMCLPPTAFDFFNDPDVLLTTPVEEGREEEYSDQLSYVFQYGSDLVHFLKSTGFKLPNGFTFDNDTADADFASLTAGLGHVMFPISYNEATKLLDLEHEYEFYHVTMNEILFCLLPHPLRGSALTLYHECARSHPADGRYALQRLRYEVEGVPDADGMRYWTQMRAIVISETVDPAPQLATIRRLCERHRKVKPTYGDSDRVADLWHILAESAKKSPYVTPLYLVVLRELRSGQEVIPSLLTASLFASALPFGTKAPLPHFRPSRIPPLHMAPQATAPTKTQTQKPQTPDPPSRPTAMALRPQKQPKAPLDGEWVADSPTALYKKWSGTGYPCAVCFRMRGVTDAHAGTRGACPYVCIEAFANDKHLEMSKPAAPRPSLRPPSAGGTPDPPPAGNAPAPSADSGLEPAFQSVRLQLPTPGGDDAVDPVDAAATVVRVEDSDAPPLVDGPIGASLARHGIGWNKQYR